MDRNCLANQAAFGINAVLAAVGYNSASCSGG